jgi:outer membrane protein insertion porin family
VYRRGGVMRYAGTLCLLAAFLSSPASAREILVRSIDVRGVTAFSPSEVLGWCATAPGRPLSDTTLHADLRLLAERYRSSGYWTACASVADRSFTSDSQRVDLTLEVREGRRTIIGRAEWTGMPAPRDGGWDALLEALPGAPATATTIEGDIALVLEHCGRTGYPLARCEVESAAVRRGPDEDSLVVWMHVDAGDRVSIEEIRVAGLRETEPSVVVRETRLRSGDLYDAREVDAVRPRLERLNIFSRIDEPVLFLRGRQGGLLLRVEEGKTSTFDGVLGYLPGAAGEGGTVTGLASVSMRNLFGTGRRLSARWQRDDRTSQEIAFRYLEPWVFGAPVSVGGGFLQRQQDSTYVIRAFDGRVDLLASRELTLAGVITSESVIPADDSGRVLLPRSTTTAVGTEIEYDTRNEAVSPTAGVRYRAEYRYGRKRLPAGSSASVQRFGVDVQVYYEVVRRQVLALGVHGRQVRGGAVDESDLYRFGGTTTLRGYRESQFLGTGLAWSNVEYRFVLARRTYAYGFFDAGYYTRPAEVRRGLPGAEAWKTGFGAGVRLETPLGNLGVSIALGQGDTFGTAKVHVGLINEF